MDSRFKVKKTAWDIVGKCVFGLSIVLLIIYCISLIITLFWMLSTSFKGPIEYYFNSYNLPKEWIFTNYPDVFRMLRIDLATVNGIVTYSIFDMFGISVIWSFGTAFMNVLITSMTAYVIARYKFFGRNFLYSLGIFVMIMPIIGAMPSAMVLRKALGVYDNMLLMILTAPATAFSGLHFLLLHASFKRLSTAYSEAAFIDGAGHVKVFFRIMLPLMLPTCMVLFVLNFLGAWNDYGTFLIWLPSKVNLAFGMYLFQNDAAKYMASMPQIMAGFVIVLMPTILLFCLSQKLILSKLNVGGLKG